MRISIIILTRWPLHLTLVCLTCRRVGGGGGGAIGGEMGGVDFFDQSDATPKRPAMLVSLIGRSNSFILVCTRTLKQWFLRLTS